MGHGWINYLKGRDIAGQQHTTTGFEQPFVEHPAVNVFTYWTVFQRSQPSMIS
jgi:hypothetical protein